MKKNRVRNLSKSKLSKLIVTVIVGAAAAYFSKGQDKVNSQITGELVFTKHALCRMDCRKIDESEVREVIQAGKINSRKSNAKSQPCPTQALEKRTKDKQLVRVVVAKCPRKSKIITVIDLENEYKCYCK